MSLSAYIAAALAGARFKTLDDKTWLGEIPGFEGVWANEKTMKKCRETLREVLEAWIVFKLRSDETLPAVRGKRLALPKLVPV
jgi:predicted RNase H-like HicB family nuclease